MQVAIYTFTVNQSAEIKCKAFRRLLVAVITLHRKPGQMRNVPGKEWSDRDTPKPVKLHASGSKHLLDTTLPASDRTVIIECFEANKAFGLVTDMTTEQVNAESHYYIVRLPFLRSVDNPLMAGNTHITENSQYDCQQLDSFRKVTNIKK
jgi:hypothetical protein